MSAAANLLVALILKQTIQAALAELDARVARAITEGRDLTQEEMGEIADGLDTEKLKAHAAHAARVQAEG